MPTKHTMNYTRECYISSKVAPKYFCKRFPHESSSCLFVLVKLAVPTVYPTPSHLMRHHFCLQRGFLPLSVAIPYGLQPLRKMISFLFSSSNNRLFLLGVCSEYFNHAFSHFRLCIIINFIGLMFPGGLSMGRVHI